MVGGECGIQVTTLPLLGFVLSSRQGLFHRCETPLSSTGVTSSIRGKSSVPSKVELWLSKDVCCLCFVSSATFSLTLSHMLFRQLTSCLEFSFCLTLSRSI